MTTVSATKPRPATKAQKRRAQSELRDWHAKFINYLRLTGSDSTAIRYDQALEMFFSQFKNALIPADILRMHVEDYKIIRKRMGTGNATINLELSAGKALYDFIIRMSDMPIINPFAGGKRLKVAEHVRRSMALADVEKIFAATTEPQEILLATLLFTTGIRGDEAVRVEKKHFDLENGLLPMPAEICKGKKKGRTVPVRDDLKELVAALPDGKLFQGWADNWKQLNYRWRRLLWKAEVGATGLHTTRKTFGTAMIRSGLDVATVRDILGHQSIKTTNEYLVGQQADVARSSLTNIPGGHTVA
jgi:site-specific recombinase XerD